MAISEECKAAMIEHGVLMKGGQPAGADLMKQDVIKVSLVSLETDPELRKAFFDMAKDVLVGKYSHAAENLHTFPEDIEDIVRESTGYWYEGKIEFVSETENPDLRIFPYQMPRQGLAYPPGFATYPLNDHPEASQFSSDVRLMGIATYNPLFGGAFVGREELSGIIKHEFGHNLGVLHPEAALMQAKQDSKVCDDNDFSLRRTLNRGYMGQHTPPTENYYDKGTRDHIRDASSGASPNDSNYKISPP